jgi:hypothetical protein
MNPAMPTPSLCVELMRRVPGVRNGRYQINAATSSRPMARASLRTSRFWSSRRLMMRGPSSEPLQAIGTQRESLPLSCRSRRCQLARDYAQSALGVAAAVRTGAAAAAGRVL